MKTQHTLRTALRALRRNIMRAALTILGIVIGIAAVIAMVEIGRGSSSAIQKTISSLGANTLLVLPGTAASGGISFGAGSNLTLTPQDCDAILNKGNCPAVATAAPIVRARAQLVVGNRNWVPMQIAGTTPAFLDVRDWKQFSEGGMFTDRDVLNGNKVCVLGQTIVTQLFGNESPIGKEVRVRNVAFKVVGVLERKGANMMGMDQDDILIAPWTTIKYRVSGTTLANANQSTSSGASSAVNTLSGIYPSQQGGLYPAVSDVQAADTPLPVRFTNVDQILVSAASGPEIPQAIRQITSLLRERHHLRAGDSDDFNIRNMTEIATAWTSITTQMSNLLLAVALISLMVGGVGIMNIMLVSVTERTREIGLRMAVGARPGDILRQFLAEAVVLCLTGGIVGILLGRLTSFLITYYKHWPTESSAAAVVAAVAVSVTVGVVFGFYPAWKASRLDPIEALRYE